MGWKMAAWGRVEKKVGRREFLKDREQRYLERRSELDESLEEVFDRQTLMTLYEMLNAKKLKEVRGVVSSGKESRVYHGLGWNGEEFAVKIYLVSSAEFRRNRLQYVVNDPRFKKIPREFRRFVYLWSEREYANLKEAYGAGVPVPQPFHQSGNILVMEFLGENGVRLPLLHEEKFEKDELENIYIQIVDVLGRMYREAGLVHGDLSQYNIMVGRGLKVYLIDLAQAVRRSHPMSETFLEHGVKILCSFFEKSGLTVDWGSTLDRVRRGG
ncbi:MAG: serine protein kinase RIO [Candidatus Caldarchaeum sp.]|nr:serine protein kinase RIO [Candidatus Caldarchaeum sp.]MCS7137502.1 serine protein kinase RIO [Candidatus Caldarchaeum sp.]MDW7978428.1 serine protein kinase RIO [Candidatus Caldarchaeum sp.]